MVDRKIRTFDKAIEKYIAEVDNDIKKCPAFWRKQIFLATLDFEMLDWRVIQTNDYWKIRDSLHGIDRSKFILDSVKEYIKQNKQR